MEKIIANYLDQMLNKDTQFSDEEIIAILFQIQKDTRWKLHTSDDCGKIKILLLGLLGLGTYGQRLRKLLNCNSDCSMSHAFFSIRALEAFGEAANAFLEDRPTHNIKIHPELPERAKKIILSVTSER